MVTDATIVQPERAPDIAMQRSKDHASDDRAATPALRLEEFLPYRLNVLAALASEALSRIYRERHGISVPEWRVLATLGQYGRLTARDIGAHSHMHKTKVSRAVADLEARRLVIRTVSREDRREAHLSLTAKGRRVYCDLVPEALAFGRVLEEGLSAGERRALDKAITTLTRRAADLHTGGNSGNREVEGT